MEICQNLMMIPIWYVLQATKGWVPFVALNSEMNIVRYIAVVDIL